MSARVVTVTSGKGGVGKTTTTANVAAALALMKQQVVCIDADIGLRNLDLVMGMESRIVYDLVDVVEGRCQLRQAIIRHKQLPELALIPAAQSRDKTAVSPTQMIQIVTQLRPDFDFIIIDSPAGIERGFRNAVAPADEVLIVTNPEVSAVRDADRIVGLLEASNPKIPIRLIINRVRAEMVRKNEMLSAGDILDILSIKLIGLVPEDKSILIASNKGTPDGGSRAGQAFRDIGRRLMGEDVPFPGMDKAGNTSGGIFRRIAQLFGG